MNFHFGHLLECREMKVSLNQYLGWDGKLTHRQSNVWSEFRLEELNRPSRLDHYIMQCTATVTRLFAKNPNSVKAEHFQLTFKRKGSINTPLSEDEFNKDVKMSQATMIAIAGGSKGLTIKDQFGNIIKHPEIPTVGQRRAVQSTPPQQQNAVGQSTPLSQRKIRRRMK